MASASPPLRRARKFQPKPARPPIAPRILRWLVFLAAAVILVDALIGERGLLDGLRARQEYAALQAQVERLRAENAHLREDARRLKEDPGAIEAIARDELGLIFPGETLFIISDQTVPARR